MGTLRALHKANSQRASIRYRGDPLYCGLKLATANWNQANHQVFAADPVLLIDLSRNGLGIVTPYLVMKDQHLSLDLSGWGVVVRHIHAQVRNTQAVSKSLCRIGVRIDWGLAENRICRADYEHLYQLVSIYGESAAVW